MEIVLPRTIFFEVANVTDVVLTRGTSQELIKVRNKTRDVGHEL